MDDLQPMAFDDESNKIGMVTKSTGKIKTIIGNGRINDLPPNFVSNLGTGPNTFIYWRQFLDEIITSKFA